MVNIKITLLLSAALLTVKVHSQNWSLGGNAGTSPGSSGVGAPVDGSFIGTTDNSNLVLGTAWSKRAIIDLHSNMWGGNYTAPMPDGVSNCFAWGIGNTFAAPINNSAAFGYQNSISASACLTTGQWNTLGATATYSVVSGYGNTNNASTSLIAGYYNFLGPTATTGVAFGIGNRCDASMGLVTGQWNTLSETATGAVSFGYFSQNAAPRGLITGQQNVLTATAINSVAMGTYNSASGTNSFALGWANNAANDRSMAIGASASTTADNQFAANFDGGYNLMGGRVGIGTSSPQAKLEINSGMPGIGGLRLTNMVSSIGSSIGVLPQPIGVDASGNLVPISGAMPTLTAPLSTTMQAFGLGAPTGTVNYNSNDMNDGGNGIGMILGANVGSPTVWMYNYGNNNAFTVANKNYTGQGPAAIDGALTPLFQIRGNGNVGIGTTSPHAKLEINSSSPNTSGLRFTNLTSASPVSTGQAIGVDASGNVVTVTSGSGFDGDYNSLTNKPNNYLSSYNNPVTPATMASSFNMGNVAGNLTYLTPPGDGSSGFGIINAPYIASPVIWMYDNNDNSFTIANRGYAYDQSERVTNAGNALSPLFQVRTNGKVGIGTTAPQAKLDISGNIRIADGTQGAGKVLTCGTDGIASWQPAGGNGGTATFPYGGNGEVQFNNNGFFGSSNGLYWDNANSVLSIGQPVAPNNSYKLNVNGNIRANKLTVNTTGADFVFSPSYKLKSLAEVEDYVKVNQHLPDIAPAAEMEKEGVEVGESQTKLLQKIEELTLYIIQQNKKIDVQNQRIRSQNKQLVEQDRRISGLEAKAKK